MASSLHRKEIKTSDHENMSQYEELARDSKWIIPMESGSDCANITEQTYMDEMIRSEARDSGRTDDENEDSTKISEIPEISVESFQLREHRAFNHIGGGYSNPEQRFGASTDMSTCVAGVSNWEAFTDSAVQTEAVGIEPPSFLSIPNCEDNSRESTSSQIQLVTLPQISISTRTPAPHIQHCESSTSSVNPSTSFSEPSSIDLYAPAPDIHTRASSSVMDRPQAPDQVSSSQLSDSQVASPPYDGMMSPLMFIPPPPYASQPPGYDSIQRTCSVSTISELQRSAPFTWEMPPSYDATRDTDRLCLVQDLRRHRSATTSDWNKKNFLCCVSFAVFTFVGLAALGFFVNNVAQ